MTGFNLPPGCTTADIDRQAGIDPVCAECGKPQDLHINHRWCYRGQDYQYVEEWPVEADAPVPHYEPIFNEGSEL